MSTQGRTLTEEERQWEYDRFIPWPDRPFLGFRQCLTCWALTVPTTESLRGHIQYHIDEGHMVRVRQDATMVTETGHSGAKGGKKT